MAATSAALGATGGRGRVGRRGGGAARGRRRRRRRRRIRHPLRAVRRPYFNFSIASSVPATTRRSHTGGVPGGVRRPPELRTGARLPGPAVTAARNPPTTPSARASTASRPRGSQAKRRVRSRRPRHPGPEPTEMHTTLQGDVREANGRLPERRREVLRCASSRGSPTTRSPSEWAWTRTSVAEPASRGRGFQLRDELRDMAPRLDPQDRPRARALTAMRQDRELDDAGGRARLVEHLEGCETCPARRQEVIQEARISYRAWLPIPPPSWLGTRSRPGRRAGGRRLERRRERSWRAGGSGAVAPATAARRMIACHPLDVLVGIRGLISRGAAGCWRPGIWP